MARDCISEVDQAPATPPRARSVTSAHCKPVERPIVSPMRLRERGGGEGGRKAYATYAAPAQIRKRVVSSSSAAAAAVVESGPLTKSRRRANLADQIAPRFGRPLVYEAECQPASAAIIWLHGFQDTPEWRATHLAAARAAHPRWKWIFLRAGRLPITCYKTAARERYVPSWGDFLDPGTIHVGSQDHESVDPGGWYAATATLVASVLEDLERDDGIPPTRVVLVGQSQGAACAAHAALQYPRKLGGLAMLQGWLLPAARAALAGEARGAASADADATDGDGDGDRCADARAPPEPSRHTGLPVLVAHGTADREVAYDCATLARRLLLRAGAALDFHSMPGTGHFLDDAEELDLQRRAVAFAEKALGKKTRGERPAATAR